MRQRVEEKNKLLRQLAAPAAGLAGGLAGGGAGPVDLSAVTQRWDGFTAALHQVGDLHPPASRQCTSRARAVPVPKLENTPTPPPCRYP